MPRMQHPCPATTLEQLHTRTLAHHTLLSSLSCLQISHPCKHPPAAYPSKGTLQGIIRFRPSTSFCYPWYNHPLQNTSHPQSKRYPWVDHHPQPTPTPSHRLCPIVLFIESTSFANSMTPQSPAKNLCVIFTRCFVTNPSLFQALS